MSSSAHPHRIEELLAQVDWVRDLARHLIGSAREADVDDVVQDTMLCALSSPPRRDGPIRGWLATVARNVLRQHQRRDGRRGRYESLAAEPGRVPTPAESVEVAERQHVVVGAVLALPEPYRHTLLLYYFHGLQEPEIAEQTATIRSTVKSRLQRGRELLREDLRGRYGEEWAVALLPLALWPARPRPPGAPSLSVGPTSRVAPIAAAVAVLLTAGIVASVWWGDWWNAPGGPDPATAAATADLAGQGNPVHARERVEVARPAPAEDVSGAPAAAEAAEVVEATDESRPTPEGAFRICVEDLPGDLAVRPQVRIQPFRATNSDDPGTWLPEARTVDLEEDCVDVDVARLFGPELDCVDAEVTLLHPDLLRSHARVLIAGPGDPGVVAELTAIRAAIVSGYVLDADGNKVAGATVLAGIEWEQRRERPVREVVDRDTTDAGGAYRLRVPAGVALRVLAMHPARGAGFREIVAPAQGGSVPVDVPLERGIDLSGRVLLPPGADPTAVTVEADVQSWNELPYRLDDKLGIVEEGRPVLATARARVAADGTFVLRGLSPRPYWVREVVEFTTPERRETAQVACTPAPGVQVELDLRLVELPLHVVDEEGRGIAEARAGARCHGYAYGAFGSTGADGRVVLSVVPGGESTWRVDAPGRAPVTGVVTLTGGNQPGEVVVRMGPRPDASWDVEIHDPDGRPVRHASFVVNALDDPRQRARPIEVDSVGGVFHVEGLPRGPCSYVIRVAAGWDDSRGYWQELRGEVNLPSPGATRSFVLGTDARRGGRLRIRIASADGEPLSAKATLTGADGVVPCTFVARQYVRSARNEAPTLTSLAPNDVQPVLEPGEYELVVECIRAQPGPPQRLTVTVVEGEVTPVDVVFPAR